MSKPSKFIVLVEDERQLNFVRRYLQRQYGTPTIRNPGLPSSRGSGEQWVRERYAQEVKAYRHRSTYAETVLVVAIDADKNDVSWRSRQLREALEQAGSAARADDEAIVHLIPKQNIETWILCLSGEKVDESNDYKRNSNIDNLIASAAVTFFDWSRPKSVLPAHVVPSLRNAIPEVTRLK